MKRTTLALTVGSSLLAAVVLAGCSSPAQSATGGAATPQSSIAPSSAAASSSTSASGAVTSTAAAAGSPVLPVASNPIVNTATAPTLQVTKATVEDNVDPATGKAINDRLQLTLKNTGNSPLGGLEVYYEMTDTVTGQKEGYYQKLDGLSIPAGQETTVYFDNQAGPGHYPENQFSIYRSSTNQVDFAIQVSAVGAKIATATAVKSKGTGEKVD